MSQLISDTTEIGILKIMVYLSIIASVVAGCAPAAKWNQVITPEFTSQQRNVLIRSIVNEETYVYVAKPKKSTHGGGLGLIGIAMDVGIRAAENAIRTSVYESQKAAAEVWRSKLEEHGKNIDFGDEFWNKLELALPSSLWLNTARVEKIRAVPSNEIIERVNTGELRMRTDSYFSSDVSVLIVSTFVWYFVPGNDNPVYSLMARYYSDPLEQRGDAAVSEWVADRAKTYRTALIKGIEENINMLNVDIFSPVQQNQARVFQQVTFFDPFLKKKVTYDAEILEQQGQRVLMRNRKGNLYSVSTITH